MDVSGFAWFLSVAVFVSIVLLAAVCLDCANKGPLVSIRQGQSEEYIPSTGFRLIHPYQPSIDPHSINPSSTHLSAFSPSLDPGAQRHHSFTLTEDESNPSYVNPTDGPDYVNTDSDGEEPGYVKVLPDPPKVEIRQSSQSLASAHSSVDVEPHYVNVDPSVESDDRDYLNVVPLQKQGASLERTCDSDSDKDSDSDSDDEGNYVNQPAMIDNQPTV